MFPTVCSLGPSIYHWPDLTIYRSLIIVTLLLAVFISICIITISLYRLRFQRLSTNISDSSLSFKSFCYSRILPHRAASRLMKPLTHKEIPVAWRPYLFKTFSNFYPVHWDDFAQDLSVYHTFHDFFTRHLECKRSMSCTDLVSPVDGTIVAYGEIDDETQTLEQIKGVRFQLHQLLYGCDTKANNANLIHKGNKLYYSIIYLSPGDYHRFHSPADDIKIDCINHVVGDLYPVKPSWLRTVPGLLAMNERMVMSGTWKEDLFFAYIAVGAFNIGSIHLKDHPYHVTNQPHQCEMKQKCIDTFDSSEELMYDKGDEIGHFSFGSTVVLIFEAPNFDFHIDREQKIRFGSALGDIGLFV